MSEKQVQSTVEPMELTTYERKVVCSEVPSFVNLMQDDSLDLLEKCNRVMSDEFSSFAMRAWALLIREFLTFEETPEDRARVDKATRVLGKLKNVDPNQVLAFKIQKDPANALALIEQSEQNKIRIQDRITQASALIRSTTQGAQRAAQIAFDRGLKYGELRDSPNGSSGNRHETLIPGVYKATLGKDHVYRVVWESAHMWSLYAVSGEKITFVANSENVSDALKNTEIEVACSSATRARKIAKSTMSYRGYTGQEAVIEGFRASLVDGQGAFHALSAGNPTEKNWQLVDSQPNVWLAQVNENKDKLPKEIVIVS